MKANVEAYFYSIPAWALGIGGVLQFGQELQQVSQGISRILSGGLTLAYPPLKIPGHVLLLVEHPPKNTAELQWGEGGGEVAQ